MDCRSAREACFVIIEGWSKPFAEELLPLFYSRCFLETFSEFARRSSCPGLKRTAERAGRCKTGLTRNLADMHVLLCQPLTRFGDASLVHELCQRQIAIRQPSLQGARAYVQLGSDHTQCETAGRQRPSYDAADFGNWYDRLVHESIHSGVTFQSLSLIADISTCHSTPLDARRGWREANIFGMILLERDRLKHE